MLILSAVLSLALVALTWFTFRGEKVSTFQALLPSFGSLVLGYCVSVPLLLSAVFMIPAVCLWKWRQWSAYALLGYLILAAGAPYAIFAFSVADEIAEFNRLKREYAFESMESRLPARQHQATAKLSKETEDYLGRLQQNIAQDSNGFRELMLERLHQQSVQTFIDSPGFGFARRIKPTDWTLKVNLDHDGTPVPQPGPPGLSYYLDDDFREPMDIKPEPLRELHLESVVNFANARGFGLIISRKQVAGFQPHQFNMVPRSKEWQVQRLELVGLLMHAEPVVYVSDELPRMEKLRKVPTRPLNNFEVAGIKRLQQGDSLFIRETTESIRMLGAVRSIEQCVKCHGGERGDLLGAFSYRLQRVP
jgi:hypothetical protein